MRALLYIEVDGLIGSVLPHRIGCLDTENLGVHCGLGQSVLSLRVFILIGAGLRNLEYNVIA